MKIDRNRCGMCSRKLSEERYPDGEYYRCNECHRLRIDEQE